MELKDLLDQLEELDPKLQREVARRLNAPQPISTREYQLEDQVQKLTATVESQQRELRKLRNQK